MCKVDSEWGPSIRQEGVEVAQSCQTLWDPMDCIVHGILQAGILEWLAYPSPADLPNPGIKLGSPALQVDSLPTELSGKPIKQERWVQSLGWEDPLEKEMATRSSILVWEIP